MINNVKSQGLQCQGSWREIPGGPIRGSEPCIIMSGGGRRETLQNRGPQPEATFLPSRQKLGQEAEERRLGCPPFAPGVALSLVQRQASSSSL